MAIIVTRGTHNAIVTVLTMVMAAAVCEMSVRIFFRDEAVYKLSKKMISELNFSEVYAGVEAELKKNYQSTGMVDLQKAIRDVKSQGDVKLYACTSSMALCGLTPDDLIPEIDEARGLTSFLLEEMDEADTVLTF
ncbi:MAG TPA: DsrE family protein [Candidatus Manganitrophaceae bacterium]|nr:DsrE family protein [Candidatus Manganitrophaceae bacterium]